MSERPVKRLRRLSTEDDDSEASVDFGPQASSSRAKTTSNVESSRSRRAGNTGAPSVTVERPSVNEDPKKSIHLTVKMPSSKLREATTGSKKSGGLKSRDAFEHGEILTGPRGSRAKRAIVEESGSSEEDEEDFEGDDHDEEEQEDAEGESDDEVAGGDVSMQDDSPRPLSRAPMAPAAAKPKVTVTPAKDTRLKSVEDKEMELGDEDDDEELSELESEDEDAEGEDAEDEEEDAEGEEDMDDAEGDEDELGSEDGATPATGSRASTPDLSKLTRRQRGRMDEILPGELLALPSETKAKKILTAEEYAMRRAEMARRRKNLSEKRNEEEKVFFKMETINKLLKKQAPKTRRIRQPENEGDDTPMTTEVEVEKPKATVVRWTSTREGSRICVPTEWLEAPVGKVFEPAVPPREMSMTGA
ncbi:MAG: hypothetical protein M1817_002598 [Caeruleum heppii]|nr:MAG: hypothetical protein M1817_002598 [Caeruleum heppii]